MTVAMEAAVAIEGWDGDLVSRWRMDKKTTAADGSWDVGDGADGGCGSE